MQERNFASCFLNRSLGFGSRQHNDGSGLPMQITSWRFLFRLNFYNKGQTFFFVSNCLQGIELTQADLSARDLLEGHWENITESDPCVPEPGKEVPTLTICLWGHTVSLSAPLSQYGVHSSSSLWTSRISSLIQSRGPNVACCLNPGLTEPHKSGTCSFTAWNPSSNFLGEGIWWPQWGSAVAKDGAHRPAPSLQQVLRDSGSQRRAVGHRGPVEVWAAPSQWDHSCIQL